MKANKHLLFTIIYLAIAADGYCQKTLLDSLNLRLEQYDLQVKESKREYPAPADSIKVILINKIAREVLENGDWELSKQFADSAYSLSNKINYKKGIIESLNQKGIYYSFKSDYKTARNIYENALKAAQDIGSQRSISACYSNIADVDQAEGNYVQALDNYTRSLHIDDSVNDRRGIPIGLANIGSVYQTMGKIKEAMDYYTKALKIYEEDGKKLDAARTISYIGNIMEGEGNYKGALENYLKTYEYCKLENNPVGISYSLMNLGNVYTALNDYDKAVTCFTDALKMKEELGDQGEIALCYINMGAIDLKVKKYGDAKRNYQRGMEISTQLGENNYLRMAYEGLAKSNYLLNNYKDAYDYHVKFKQLTDSIFNEDNSKQLSDIKTNYEVEKKEAELKAQQLKKDIEQKAELQRRNFIMYGIAIALLFVIVIAIVTFIGLKRNQKQKRIISEQKEKVEKQNLEKETLLKEIHHRVKNNLQVISSLLELQSGDVEDETAKAALSEGQNRVKSIALIHQKLYQHENLAAIELNNFVNELYRQGGSIFAKKDQAVEVDFSIPETFIDIDTAVPLGLILNELLTNSFKYAFEQGRNNELRIGLVTEANGKYNLSYFDNGSGLPTGVDLNKSKSLGLRLIHRLSKQIGGSAQYHFNKGSIFTINFADTETRRQ